MATKEVESIIEENTVIIPSQEYADPLLHLGYGTNRGEEQGSILTSYEALYLISEKRIRVTDSKTKKDLTFQSLLAKFRLDDAEAWTKYLIYRDLRSRGYAVREGYGTGINFRMYERGEYGEQAAKYVVIAICEGNNVPIDSLIEALRLSQSVKKDLILAVVDRRSEIVYYNVKSITF